MAVVHTKLPLPEPACHHDDRANFKTAIKTPLSPGNFS